MSTKIPGMVHLGHILPHSLSYKADRPKSSQGGHQLLIIFFKTLSVRVSDENKNHSENDGRHKEAYLILVYIIGLDSYILNSLNYLNLIWIYISHCMTSLLKLEITV